MIIHNIEEFAQYLETDTARLERDIYDYTDCGAWIKWTDKEILIGSIVEDSEKEFSCNPLVFPFDINDYETEINWLEEETSREWHRANPQPEDIKNFILDLFAYDEKPTRLYTLEDATTDLDEHRKTFDGDDEIIDLYAIGPEDYMEAMNDCIKNEWKSEKKSNEEDSNMMTAAMAEEKALDIIRGRTTEQLVSDFEVTEDMRLTMELITVRGWIMNELERRNPSAYENWIEAYSISPRIFFL